MRPPEAGAVGERARWWRALLVHDDYVAFCQGVRGLCDIDLLQYKRGQMERRVRSFAERRGHADLAPYLRCSPATPPRATSSSTA